MSDEGTGASGAETTAPLAPDRPVVDGTAVSAAQLRAEVAREDEHDSTRVDGLRGDVGATVTELAGRFDVPSRMRERRDRTVAELRRGAPGLPWVAVLGAAAAVALVLARRANQK